MGWRQRLQVRTSNASMQVLEELLRRGVAGLELEVGFKFDYEKYHVHGTWADLYHKPTQTPIFLDGQLVTNKGFPKLHLKGKQARRDQLVDQALRLEYGLEPLRFPYHPPLTKTRLNEICTEIMERIG